MNDIDNCLDDEDPLTVHPKELLEARVAAYATDPDAGAHGNTLRAELETCAEAAHLKLKSHLLHGWITGIIMKCIERSFRDNPDNDQA